MGKIFVISVVSRRRSKTLINNTALEVDDMDYIYSTIRNSKKQTPMSRDFTGLQLR